MRRLWLIALALVGFTVLPAEALTETEIKSYDPFTADGRLKDRLRVEHVGNTGDCFRSGLLKRAYACPAGLDPCFDDPRRDRLICTTRPWSRKVFAATYDRLDRDVYITRSQPFALILRNGRRCQFIHGATTVVDGRRLNYFCGRRHFLFGFPDRRPRFWRIRHARNGDGDGMRKLRIRRAWL